MRCAAPLARPTRSPASQRHRGTPPTRGTHLAVEPEPSWIFRLTNPGVADGARRRRSQDQAEGGAVAELPLHENRVQPTLEFETDGLQRANLAKAEYFVKPDRGKIPAVADDGNDLVKISDRTLGKKGAHQASTQALSHAIRTNVDRIFNRVPVGRPHPIRSNMGVADDSAVPLGDKVRKSFVEEVAASPDHFGVARWFDLKGARRVQDVMTINLGDGSHVAFLARTNARARRGENEALIGVGGRLGHGA